MLALSFFLLASSPTSGGIQVRDMHFYFLQSIRLFDPASYFSFLSTFLFSLCMSCHEIRTRSRLYDAQALITTLQPLAAFSSSCSAVSLFWCAVLQHLQHHHRAVFSFVLAALRFKKQDLFSHALHALLLAWRLCPARGLHAVSVGPLRLSHAQNYLVSEAQILLLQQPVVDWDALARVQRLAFSPQHPAVRATLFSSLHFFPADRFPLQLTDCALPFILPHSLRVQYDENATADPASWPFLSDAPDAEDAFAPLLSSLARCRLRAAAIPQFYEHSPYGFGGKKPQPILPLGARVAVRLTLRNPLQEALVCERAVLIATAARAEEEAFELAPLEERAVRLLLTVTQEGECAITGVEFTMRAAGGTERVVVTQALQARGRRLNQTAEQRRRCVYGEESCLRLRVRTEGIRACCELKELKPAVFFSELVALPLTVQNRGTEPIVAVFLLTNNYHWFVSQQDPHAVATLTNSQQALPATDFAQVYSLLRRGQTLAPGETLTAPTYLHLPEGNGCAFLREEGSHTFYSLQCVVLLGGADGSWRMVRMRREVELKPLLDTRCSVVMDREDMLFFKVVAENVAEEEIEEISVGVWGGSEE